MKTRRSISAAALVFVLGSIYSATAQDSEWGLAAGRQESRSPSPILVEALSRWVSAKLDLPKVSDVPLVRFATPEAMLALRYRGVAADHFASSEEPDILALYDSERRTIYLRDDWSGASAGELSSLVHEITHYIQDVAGLKFACGEAREEQAFIAQQQWLALFGKDLATEFGLDAFTLLVRTNCAP